MTPLQVYYKLVAHRNRKLQEENNMRRMAFYTVAPHWNGKMKLRYLWQLWHIPEIDGDIKKTIKYTTVRKMTEEEKKWLEKIRKK